MRFIFLFSLSLNLFSQTQFIMMPNIEDLDRLSKIFEVTDEPFPVHLIYNRETKVVKALGIAKSHKVRNGVHARLMVAAGLVKNLYEAKNSDHPYHAGTLFLERVKGRAVLSVHGRNSYRSSINKRYTDSPYNTVIKSIPTNVLKQISESVGISILNASDKLDQRIREINEERYLKGLGSLEASEVRRWNRLDHNRRIQQIDINSNKKKILEYFFGREDIPKLEVTHHSAEVQEIIDLRVNFPCTQNLVAQ